MKFDKVTPEHIRQYRSDILKSSSASTFDRKVFSLKKFFEWAVKEGYIDENPVEVFLKEEADAVETKVAKIERQKKVYAPSYGSLQSRIIAKLAGKPKLQKAIYSLFYTRPKWYQTYHTLPIANYFNYGILVILMSALGFGIYTQFFKTTSAPLAYPSSLTRAGRYLSFQGRLTNILGNPITSATNVDFKLYNASASGTMLWDSGTCSITPDTDGIFSTLLGSSCGTEIAASVFSENAAVWLGVTVGADTEASPRVQIATVAYALNSETLQGYPASAAATANTVPVMNNSGQIVLAVSSPKIQSTSGNFAVEGQALTLNTQSGSGGSINIAPDGTGSATFTFSGATPGNGKGMLYATDANLNSRALIYGSVTNDSSGYNLLELASGTTPRTKFAIDSAGNATLSGTINGLAISGGNITSGAWNGSIISSQYGGTGANNSSAAQYSIPYYSATGVMGGALAPSTAGYILSTNSTGGAPSWIPASGVGTNYWQLANHVLAPSNALDNDLAIGGNATSSAKFQVLAGSGNLISSGNASISGSLTFGAGAGSIQATNKAHLTLGGATTGGIDFGSPITSGTWNGGAIGATYGGTGQTAYAIGDLLYADTTTSLAKLSDVATGNVLISGGLNTAPSWGKVVLGTHTTGNYVSSINGTANQISANVTTGDVTLSIPSDFRAPGTVNAVNGLYTGATAGTQRIDASGNLVNIANISASGYATISASLSVGTGVALAGPGNINASGKITGTAIYQGANQVCDTSGNCASIGNYWQLANHVLAPANAADYDLAVGGNSTASAKFQVFAANGNMTTAGTASVSGNLTLGNGSALQSAYGPLTLNYKSGANAWTAGLTLTNAGYVGIGTTIPLATLDVNGAASASGSLTFRSGAASIQTTTLSNLTIGGSTTGNVIINSKNSTALTANGANLTASGIVYFANGTTYYIDASGNANLNAGTFAGDVAVNGADLTTTTTGTATLFNTNATTLNVGGAANTLAFGAASSTTTFGSTTFTLGGNSTLNGGAASAGTMQINSTSNATKGNLSFNGTTTYIDGGGNLKVGGYATASASLALGNTNAAAGPGNLNMTGVLTVGGAINGLNISSGTITNATWNGNLITSQYGGTGANNSAAAQYAVPYYSATGVLGGAVAPSTAGYVLSTNSTGSAPTWIPMTATGTNYWQLANHVLAPSNALDNDLAVGGNSTASAKFLVNAATGNLTTLGTASVSGNLTLGNGSALQSAYGPLTLNYKSGANTWATGLTIRDISGNVGVGTTSPIAKLDVNGNLNLTGYATMSASLAVGNINAVAGPGNISASGTIAGVVLTQNGNTVCDISGNCTAATDIWSLGNGALYPKNSSADLLIGASATSSAKFAFLNVLKNTPTASISGSTTNVAMYMDGNGNISTTNRANLVLGNSSTYNTTGNILLNPNGTGNVGIGTTTPLQALDVNGYIRGQRFVDTSNSNYFLDPAAATISAVLAGDASTSGALTFFGSNPSKINILNGNRLDFQMSVGGDLGLNSVVSIANNGFLGIGTTTPSSALDVSGGAIAGESTNVVTNGTFDADTNWTKGTGWTIGSGVATKTAGTGSTLSQDTGEASGIVYHISFTLAQTAGVLTVSIGGVTGSTSYQYTSGTPTTVQQYIHSTGTGDLTFTADASFAGYIDNVVVTKVLPSLANSTFRDSAGTLRSELRIAGTSNTFFGRGSGQYFLSGGYNTAFGSDALANFVSGYNNVAFGEWSLHDNITGSSNTALGENTLYSSINGDDNTAIGVDALSNATSPYRNIAIGVSSMKYAGDGMYNIAIGNQALEYANGSENIVIGEMSGSNVDTGSGNILVGTGIDLPSDVSDTLDIGNVLYATGLNTWGYTTVSTTGKIGIGTYAPTDELEVRQPSVNQSALTLRTVGSNTAGQYTGMLFSAADSSVTTDTYKKAGIFFALDSTGYGRGSLILSTNGVAGSANASTSDADLVITSTGNVGIGTTSPESQLHILSTTDPAKILVDGVGSVGPNFTGRRANGSIGSLTGVVTNDNLAIFGGVGYNGSAYSNTQGGLFIKAAENWTTGSNGTYISLSTTAIGSSTLLERLRVDPTGNVGIGTTSPQQALDVNGYIRGQRFVDTSSASYYIDPAAATVSAFLAGNIVNSGAFSITTNGSNGSITLNAGSGNVIIGDGSTSKLDAGTIDPPYTINGNKYATYVSSMTGVKEETTGTAMTSEFIPGQGYRTSLDFANAADGSDLWVFSNVTNLSQNSDKLVVLLSPAANTKAWYSMDQTGKLYIYTSQPTTVSYRLTAPRFDAEKWQNTRDSGVAGFTIDGNNNWPALSEVPDPGVIDFNYYDLVASAEGTQKYNVVNSVTGQLIQDVTELSQAIIGNIKAGVVVTKDLAANTFEAFQGSVDNMLVKSGLVAGRIQTKLISPLADSTDITVQIGSEATPSGKFAIENSSGDTVASIDNIGNATFSGTLFADKINSKSLDDIQNMLTQVKADQDLLAQASTWSINSTNSASLTQIATADLYVTNQAAVNSLSVTNSLTLGTDMVFGSSIDGQGTIINSLDTLTSPLKIQSLAMAPVEIMAGLIKIDTKGNVQIAGDLAVAGNIDSAGLTLKDNPNMATPSANLLTLQNSDGSTVSTVDASGSATFNTIMTQGLTIAGATANATASAVVNGVITTNATAGSAIIPAGTSEITIKNDKVTDYTLVYVTPTSSTNNYVLYVKSKGAGQFVVGFTNPIDTDVNFNWWIVKVSQ